MVRAQVFFGLLAAVCVFPACAVSSSSDADDTVTDVRSDDATEGDERVATTASALISNVVGIQSLGGNQYLVACAHGAATYSEVRSLAELQAGIACLGASQVRCVQRCASRWYTGVCRVTGPDFCAVGSPTCTPQCAARWNNGTCREYGADACGIGPTACVPRCTGRFLNGTCYQWGPDYCAMGTNVSCAPRCLSRLPNGACTQYGADFCTF